MRNNYRIDDFQQTYFVINSFDDLLAAAMQDFGPVSDRLADGVSLKPQDLAKCDRVDYIGDQAYFKDRAAA